MCHLGKSIDDDENHRVALFVFCRIPRKSIPIRVQGPSGNVRGCSLPKGFSREGWCDVLLGFESVFNLFLEHQAQSHLNIFNNHRDGLWRGTLVLSCRQMSNVKNKISS